MILNFEFIWNLVKIHLTPANIYCLTMSDAPILFLCARGTVGAKNDRMGLVNSYNPQGITQLLYVLYCLDAVDAGGFAAADKEAAERSVPIAVRKFGSVLCNARKSFDVVMSN